MGVVVQNGRITRGSIMKNILGGTSQDEERAWAAARKAAMGDEIEAMPMKMQTVIDPGNISGGQAQRILLARALVNDPSIIILDEATSALDNASQAQVTEAMDSLNATRIVIAHRLSTIMAADSIVVMERGVAVEAGTFQELIERQGAFYALVHRQTA
jgi:ABC-type bacteriocin/lantibiotic exporter with double-glycine peptidase domain